MLPRAGRGLGRLAMKLVGKAERDDLHLRKLQQVAVICEPAGDSVFVGKRANVRLGGRSGRHHFRFRNASQSLRMKLSNEARADDAYSNRAHLLSPLVMFARLAR